MTRTIPNLRFPEFSDELTEKEVGDFAPLQRGFDLPASQVVEGPYPVVFSNGILKFHNQSKVNAPGVVTGRSGTIGKVTYVEDNYWPHNTALWVTDFCNNNPKYVYYFYEQLRLERFAAGSGVPTLNRNDVHQHIVYVPSPKEQQKIATFLSAVDEKIGHLTSKKVLLLKYKRGVMQQIFAQKVRFKDDNGTYFPDWEEKKIGEIFEVTRGKVLAMSEVSKIRTEDSPYPVYSSQTVNRGLAGYFRDYLFENCITWTTDGAEAGDVNFRKGKFYCTNVCGVLKSDIGYANQFTAELLKTKTRKHVSYVGNPKLMNNVMAQITIYIPKSIREQNIISSFLASIETRIDFIEKQLAKTKMFKKGLLQQMFV